MKTKSIILSLIYSLFAVAAWAQNVEGDDMYFNSKDRAKLREEKKQKDLAYASSLSRYNASDAPKNNDNTDELTTSYSARNVNPEYTSRSTSQTAQSDDEDYFINDYQYSNSGYSKINNYNNWNDSYSSWYNNPWYNYSWYGPSMYAFRSPYYGGYYNPYDPWYDPYYGWGSSFGYGWGNSWNYGGGWGWGSSINIGFGYGYGNPYYSNYYGGWGSRYWGNPYYGNTVVIVNNNGETSGGRRVVSGTRGNRNGRVGSFDDSAAGFTSRTRSDAAINSGRGRNDNSSSGNGNEGGRIATPQNRRQDDYYNRSTRESSRRTYQDNSQSTTPSRNYNTENNSNRNWSNGDNNSRSNSSYDNGGSRQRSSSYDNSGSFSTPSRSSGSGGGGGGSNSSGGGGGGRTRGR